MFRPTDPQDSLFQTSNLLTDEKRTRLERTWAWQFRSEALRLIDEELFRDLYCADNGRPNKSVQMTVGILILKEMFDLTDEDTLDQVEYDLRWQVALGLTPEDAHCCQKTLHNFRAKLMGNERVKLLFNTLTGGMLSKLGLSTDKQRLDSTHIVSNIARLTRLGLFCETIRLFLRDLRKESKEQFEKLSPSLRGRYLKDDGGDSSYHDGRAEEARRRLEVCARDAYRLADRFKQDKDALGMPSYGMLARLLFEQCEITNKLSAPKDDDADREDIAVPVELKESKEVSSASLQTPHDKDVTYSGHKGKGYEVQIAETVGNGEKPELLTHVEVTPACKSDEAATVPVLDALAERKIQPKVLITDTNYASAANVIECENRGTEMVAPVRGPAAETPGENEKTLADFEVKIEAESKLVVCPAGQAPESVETKESGSIVATYSKLHCANCPFKKSCPAKRNANGTRTLKTTLKEHVLARRRRYEQTEEFRKRYAERAGIEATNSELKRAHGLGFLRVRGGDRVKLSVYLKALACNVKRMVKYLAEKARKAAKAAAGHQNGAVDVLASQSGHQYAPVRAVYYERVWRPNRVRFATAA